MLECLLNVFTKEPTDPSEVFGLIILFVVPVITIWYIIIKGIMNNPDWRISKIKAFKSGSILFDIDRAKNNIIENTIMGTLWTMVIVLFGVIIIIGCVGIYSIFTCVP